LERIAYFSKKCKFGGRTGFFSRMRRGFTENYKKHTIGVNLRKELCAEYPGQ